ncbi:ketoacyl-synt-domain-containing protein [Penicillium chermesinum]|nr:ketoacyl-synt-domain-containing protein [Penicillium chermesinum]
MPAKSLAYALFKNVVDYADRYRGMERVVIHDHEAFADITLTDERHGTWHTPPHWIDSVSHLAGLVMNGSDASNTRDYFYVTPGCQSFRLLEPLKPGARYRNYVRMFPLPDEPHMYAGDLYILREDQIVGMISQLKFRKVPRLLMDRFFSPRAAAKEASSTAVVASVPATTSPTAPSAMKSTGISLPASQEQLPQSTPSSLSAGSSEPSLDGAETPEEKEPAAGCIPEVSGVPGKCLELIAHETGLSVTDLTADATFVQLGVDSLMSLVLSEKLRSELGLEIKSSLFLECPTVGNLTCWLEQYC